MKILWNIIIIFLTTLLKLQKPKGASSVIAENLTLRLQLINLTKNRKRSLPTSTIERILFGFFAFFINPRRLSKTCISISSSTVLKFHKALVKKEYGYCESFNGKMRYELLIGEIFYTLQEARVIINDWVKEYNTVRPHSALGGKPPAPETVYPKLALAC